MICLGMSCLTMAGGYGMASTAITVPGKWCCMNSNLYSPPVFTTALDAKVWQSLLWTFLRLKHPKLQKVEWGFLTPFGHETSPQNVGGTNVCKIQCSMLVNDGNYQKRGQIKPFNQLTSHFSVELGRTAPVRQLFQLISITCGQKSDDTKKRHWWLKG